MKHEASVSSSTKIRQWEKRSTAAIIADSSRTSRCPSRWMRFMKLCDRTTISFGIFDKDLMHERLDGHDDQETALRIQLSNNLGYPTSLDKVSWRAKLILSSNSNINSLKASNASITRIETCEPQRVILLRHFIDFVWNSSTYPIVCRQTGVWRILYPNDS